MTSPRLSLRRSLVSPSSTYYEVPLTVFSSDPTEITETFKTMPPATVLVWLLTPSSETTKGITISIKYNTLITHHTIYKENVTAALIKKRIPEKKNTSEIVVSVKTKGVTSNAIRSAITLFQLYQQVVQFLMKTIFFSDIPPINKTPAIYPEPTSPRIIFQNIPGIKRIDLDEENNCLIFLNEKLKVVDKCETTDNAVKTIKKFISQIERIPQTPKTITTTISTLQREKVDLKSFAGMLPELLKSTCDGGDRDTINGIISVISKVLNENVGEEKVVIRVLFDHIRVHPVCCGIYKICGPLIDMFPNVFHPLFQTEKLGGLLATKLGRIHQNVFGEYVFQEKPFAQLKVVLVVDEDSKFNLEEYDKSTPTKQSKRRSIFFGTNTFPEPDTFVRRQSRVFQRAITPRPTQREIPKSPQQEEVSSRNEMKLEAKRLAQSVFIESLPYILKVDRTSVKIKPDPVVVEEVEGDIQYKDGFADVKEVMKFVKENIVAEPPNIELMKQICQLLLSSASMEYNDMFLNIMYSLENYFKHCFISNQDNLMVAVLVKWELIVEESLTFNIDFYRKLLKILRVYMKIAKYQSYGLGLSEKFLLPISSALQRPSTECYLDMQYDLLIELSNTFGLFIDKHLTETHAVHAIQLMYSPGEIGKLALNCIRRYLIDWDKEIANYQENVNRILGKKKDLSIVYFLVLVRLLQTFDQKNLPNNTNYTAVQNVIESLVLPPNGLLFRFLQDETGIFGVEAKVTALSFFTHFFAVNAPIIRRKTVINEYTRFAYKLFIKIYYKNVWTQDDIRVLIGALMMLNGLASHKTDYSRRAFYRLGLFSLLLHEVMLEFNMSWNNNGKEEDEIFDSFKEKIEKPKIETKREPRTVGGKRIVKANIPRLCVTGSPNKILSPRRQFTEEKKKEENGMCSPGITQISPRILLETKGKGTVAGGHKQSKSTAPGEKAEEKSYDMDNLVTPPIILKESKTPKRLSFSKTNVPCNSPDNSGSSKSSLRTSLEVGAEIGIEKDDASSTTPKTPEQSPAPSVTSEKSNEMNDLRSSCMFGKEDMKASEKKGSETVSSKEDKVIKVGKEMLGDKIGSESDKIQETEKGKGKESEENKEKAPVNEGSKAKEPVFVKPIVKKRRPPPLKMVPISNMTIGQQKADSISESTSPDPTNTNPAKQSGPLTQVEKKFKQTGKLHLILDKMMLEGGKKEQKVDENSLESMRKVRRIYMNEEVHKQIVLLLLNLIVMENGVLDPMYTDQFPDLKGMKNCLFILTCHLDHPLNAHIAKELFCQVQQNDGIRELLRLLSRQFFDETKYSVIKVIGEGAYGVCSEALVKYGSEVTLNHVVIKQIKVSESPKARSVLHDIFNEILILERYCRDQRVSHMFEYGYSDGYYNIVLYQYLSSLGSWRRNLPPSNSNVRIHLLLNIYKEVLRVCQVLNQRIIHYDIKCENFLIEPLPGVSLDAVTNPQTEIPPFRLCLADFGEACVYRNDKEANATRHRGTESIKPPEMLKMDLQSEIPVNASCDIWALGCLFYELFTSKMLFWIADVGEFYFRVLKSEDLLTEENKKLLGNNEKVIEFVQFVLNRDPIKRPHLSALVQRFEEVCESFKKENKKDLAKAIKAEKQRKLIIRKESEKEVEHDVDMSVKVTVMDFVVDIDCVFNYDNTICFGAEMVDEEVYKRGIKYVMYFGKELPTSLSLTVMNFPIPEDVEEMIGLIKKMVEMTREFVVSKRGVYICGAKGYWPAVFLVAFTMQAHFLSLYESYLYIQKVCPYVRIHETVMNGLKYFEKSAESSLFCGNDKLRHFHCLCGTVDVMLTQPIEIDQIRNCRCEADGKENCPNRHGGCRLFLDQMKTKAMFDAPFVKWVGVKQKNIVGIKKLLSTVSPVPTSGKSAKVYRCNSCGFIMFAIPKKGKERMFSGNGKPYDIFVVVNNAGIDLF